MIFSFGVCQPFQNLHSIRDDSGNNILADRVHKHHPYSLRDTAFNRVIKSILCERNNLNKSTMTGIQALNNKTITLGLLNHSSIGVKYTSMLTFSVLRFGTQSRR